jgi:surface antigen
MTKQRVAAWLVGLALGTGPAMAQQGLDQYLTRENIGRAVGAAAGALLGAQVGGGKGKLAAVAVGTLAGYWVGGEVGRRLTPRDQQGIAQSTQQALDTGEPQTWRNADTGVTTRVSVRDAGPGPSAGLKPKLERVPPLELLNEYWVADANINIRGGPGTDYAILGRLPRGERVPVVGRVAGSDWLLLGEAGQGSGFVYGPLASPDERQASTGNALRESLLRDERPRTYLVEESQCRVITQDVTLADGTGRSHDFKACRQADGSWVEV